MDIEATLARLAVPCPGETIPYGPAPEQFGQLWPGAGAGPHPVAVLLHGGYWRARYGLTDMNALAEDLSGAGFAVWNLEYRRVGSPGGGWPGTFDDITAGFRMVVDSAPGRGLDAGRIAVVGHSAGGQLALWLAARAETRPRAAVALAPVSDLVEAHRLRLSNDAAAELLGAPYADAPDRYLAASPAALVPLGVRQLLVHGTEDDTVPYEMSAGFHKAAQAAGDSIEFVSLPGIGHFELIDPATQAWRAVSARLVEILRPDGVTSSR